MPPRFSTPAVMMLACAMMAKAEDSADVGHVVQQSSSSLVFVEGGGGSGSGFVCKLKDGTFLVTNQHVLAGMARIKFTRLDNAPVKSGAAGAAVGHDVMRFALGEEAHPLVATTK